MSNNSPPGSEYRSPREEQPLQQNNKRNAGCRKKLTKVPKLPPRSRSRPQFLHESGLTTPCKSPLEKEKAPSAFPDVEELRPDLSLAKEEEQDYTNVTGVDGNRGLLCQILGLAFPALISLSVDPFMSAVDTAYIGQLDPDLGGGKVGLGALGLNTNVFYLIVYVFDFLATVPTPYVASARAKGDFDGAASIEVLGIYIRKTCVCVISSWLLGSGLTFTAYHRKSLAGQFITSALAIGVVLTLLLEYFGLSILRVMGSTSVNEAEALLFLRTRALSVPAVLLIAVGNGVYRGFLDTKTPLFIVLGANAVNFVLDPILIFKLGLGVQGAAIATVAAEWAGALGLLFFLGLKDPTVRPRMISFITSREGWEEGKEVFTSSVSSVARMAMVMIVITMAGAFAARAGPASIAAHQVALQLWMLLSYTAHSLAVSARGLIGDRMGLGMLLEARKVASLTLLLAAGWGTALLVMFQAEGDALGLLFTSDKEVLEAIDQIMDILSVMMFINIFVYTGEGVLDGAQDFVYEAFAMTLSALIGAAYIIVCASLKAEITLLDVWVGLFILQICRAATFLYRYWIDPWGPLAVRRYPENSEGPAASIEDLRE